MRRGKNNCRWLLRGRKENCGKPCEGEYCGRHNYKLRNGATNHEPCKGCGVGVKTDYRLCGDCGPIYSIEDYPEIFIKAY